MNLEICNHPAQRKLNGKPEFDEDGNPVPLFPNQRAIKFEGYVIAYVTHLRVIQFIAPLKNLPYNIEEKARELVEKELGEVPRVTAPKPPTERVYDADDSIGTDDES